MRPWQVKTLLTLLVVCFLLSCPYACISVGRSEGLFSEAIEFVAIGVTYAGAVLLACWASFGAEPLFVRLPRVAFITFLIIFSCFFGEWFSEGHSFDPMIALFPAVQVFLLSVYFFPAHHYRGKRIVGPNAGYEYYQQENTSFSIRRLFVWQTYLAILLLLRVWFFGETKISVILSFVSDTVIIAGALVSLLTFHALFVFLAVLDQENRRRNILLAVVFMLITFVGCIVATSPNLQDLDLEAVVVFLLMFCSFHVAILCALWLVRLMGYRLIQMVGSDHTPLRDTNPKSATNRFAICFAVMSLLVMVAVVDLGKRSIVRAEQVRNQKWFNLGIQLVDLGEGRGDKIDCYLAHRVQEESLRILERWPQLEAVEFTGSLVQDHQLKRVGRLTNLKTLALDNTQITDAGLVHLEGMHGLRELNLRYSKVTAEGVEKLQMALPECRILFN